MAVEAVIAFIVSRFAYRDQLSALRADGPVSGGQLGMSNGRAIPLRTASMGDHSPTSSPYPLMVLICSRGRPRLCARSRVSDGGIPASNVKTLWGS